MPYGSIQELPKGVKGNLPKDAQRIYKEAFNSAYEDHEDASDREERAHRIAWAAVKQSYHKEGDDWVKD